MAIAFKKVKGGVCSPIGFSGGAASCGIKDPGNPRLDLALIYSKYPCVSAGTFTSNRVKAAPVKVTQAHLRTRELRAIVANSGNANACTGVPGIEDARTMAKAVAATLDLRQREVGVCSTGVIGLPLPMDRMKTGLAGLADHLSARGGSEVARAIMTSDTTVKEIAISATVGGRKVRIGACAKGAGMICPSMATMLCFVTTDANISKACLQKTLLEAVEGSFNRICIDGDMSTNDTVLLLANGLAGNGILNAKDMKIFQAALNHVCLELAKMIVHDGEGISRVVTVRVTGAKSFTEANAAARAVGNSALVKTSWSGGDPNWGRIIDALGYSPARVVEEKVDIAYSASGSRKKVYSLRQGRPTSTAFGSLCKAVEPGEFDLHINLNLGEAAAMLHAADLTEEYVDFNKGDIGDPASLGG